MEGKLGYVAMLVTLALVMGLLAALAALIETRDGDEDDDPDLT